jgi:hypothetical protein
VTEPRGALGRRLLHAAAHQATAMRWQLLASPANTLAWLRDRLQRGHYRSLSVPELLATRTADTVYVFGSGASLNALTTADWRAIERGNTVSFREFPRQSFVRVDYHVTGEVDDPDDYAQRLRNNPRYSNAVIAVQEGWRAVAGNTLVGRRLLPVGNRLFRYRRTERGRYAPPSQSFDRGLVHGFGSAISVTNFAYLMGWRTIVLAGVDLYDKRYFWLPEGELRSYEKAGLSVTSPFTGAEDMVSMLGQWREILARQGVRLEVLNPRSLLAAVMPVHRFSDT